MTIEKMMCLSTGHVLKETIDAIQAKHDAELAEGHIFGLEVEPWTEKLIIYAHKEYGWLICLTGEVSTDEAFRREAPKDLLDCIIHADDNGCDWLLLDRDAELIDELPSFDW